MLKQTICLNYSTNSSAGAGHSRFLGLIFVISVIGAILVAYKKYQKKDTLTNKEDPRVLLEVEMKE